MYSSLYLIRKDFVLVRKFLMLLVPYYIIMSYTNLDSYALFALLPAMLILINSCTLDVMNNNQRFLVSLPISRVQLVLGKYLAIIPYALISVACTLILYLAALAMGRITGPLNWRELALVIGTFPLMASIYLPVYYWLGQKGTQVVNLVFLMLVMLGSTSLYSFTKSYSLTSWLYTGGQNHLLLYVIGGLGYVLIIFCSYLLSLRIFVNKDI